MKRSFAIKIAVLALFGFSGAAIADTSIREVWVCNVNEGQTMDDVRAANSAWVKFVNANVDGGRISSSILTAVVGNLEMGRFIYADDFPTLESWAASRASTQNNDEGEAIDAALAKAATCENNSLNSAETS